LPPLSTMPPPHSDPALSKTYVLHARPLLSSTMSAVYV
jgi:hypothetical protein